MFFITQTAFAQKDYDDALFYHANTGNANKVAYFLKQGANPNTYNKDTGFSPLMASSMFADTSIAKMLIKAGADVNHRNKQGRSALFYAVETNNLALTKLLLDNKADANIKTIDGLTPYQIARRNNNTIIMSMLKDAENTIDLSSYKGITSTTSLVFLGEKSNMRAEQEAMDPKNQENPKKLLMYPLSDNEVQSYIDEKILNKLPTPKTYLITPYSLLCYSYSQTIKNNTSISQETINNIFNYKDVVWIYTKPDKNSNTIEKIVITKGDKQYLPLAKKYYNPENIFSPLNINTDQLWAFPIKLFSKDEQMHIDIVYANSTKQKIKINSEHYNTLK